MPAQTDTVTPSATTEPGASSSSGQFWWIKWIIVPAAIVVAGYFVYSYRSKAIKLQEEVDILSSQLRKHDTDYKEKMQKLESEMKEKEHTHDRIMSEQKRKIDELEQQLRALSISSKRELDEKENNIRKTKNKNKELKQRTSNMTQSLRPQHGVPISESNCDNGTCPLPGFPSSHHSKFAVHE